MVVKGYSLILERKNISKSIPRIDKCIDRLHTKKAAAWNFGEE